MRNEARAVRRKNADRERFPDPAPLSLPSERHGLYDHGCGGIAISVRAHFDEK
jgi:hypothetical protein